MHTIPSAFIFAKQLDYTSSEELRDIPVLHPLIKVQCQQRDKNMRLLQLHIIRETFNTRHLASHPTHDHPFQYTICLRYHRQYAHWRFLVSGAIRSRCGTSSISLTCVLLTFR